MTNWIGRDKELYQSLGEAYTSMYENENNYEEGPRMGRAAGNHMDAHGKAGNMQGAPKAEKKDENKNPARAEAAKAADPVDKAFKAQQAGRQRAKDAAAQAGIDKVLKGEPKKTPLEMARENRAKKNKQLKNPNINQGMREDVEDDMEIIDEYDVTYADGCMIEEGKKKCKEGYKWDSEKGKCVKKKKKSSSSKTVVVVKGRGGGGYYGPGYIHGGHGGSNGGGNGEGETEGGGDGGDGGDGGE